MTTNVLQAANTAATISHATVFLSGAELTHNAKVTLAEGNNVINIEALSPNINRESLQVKLSGGAIVTSFDYSYNYLGTEADTKKVGELKKQLEALEAEYATLNTTIETTKQMLVLLQQGVEHSMTVERQNITVETIDKNIDYYQKRNAELNVKLQDLKAKALKQQEQITALKNQIAQDSKPQGKRSGLLVLNINSPKAMTASVEIKYFTPSASWTPSYELRVKDTQSPISILMRAEVKQTTGLDWQNVGLTLSSAIPSTDNKVPELGTWYVNEYKPVYSRKSAVRYDAAPMMMKAMSVNSEMGIIEEDAMDTYTIEEYVSQSEQQVALEYAINLPYNVEGNGKALNIALLEKQLDDVEYEYCVVPSKSEKVYLTAKISNWEKQNLLDGRATITYNGTFYGQTTLTTKSTEETIVLTLGEDPQIVVKREKLSESTSQKMIGRNKTLTLFYKTTIRNNKQQEINLVVKDAYPVSQNNSIDVNLNLGTETTTPSENDDQKGILTYRYKLAPSESKEQTLKIYVVYPKDMMINL